MNAWSTEECGSEFPDNVREKFQTKGDCGATHGITSDSLVFAPERLRKDG